VSKKGRPIAATRARVNDVHRLVQEGLSKREIAARVFGDARYYGRVERILCRPTSRRPNQEPSADGLMDAAPQGSHAWIRELLDRHRERLANADELPSLKDIELLMKLERQLEVAETVERLNAITRDPDS
jgi:hypothetical protein